MAYELKTKVTNITAGKYAAQNFPQDPARQKEILELVKVFEKATKKKCVMWNKIFGFGKYFYKSKDGSEHEFLASGFATPKAGYTIYTLMGHKNYPEILKNLGKYKDKGKSCLFIKNLEDVDLKVLENLIKFSLVDLNKKYKWK